MLRPPGGEDEAAEAFFRSRADARVFKFDDLGGRHRLAGFDHPGAAHLQGPLLSEGEATLLVEATDPGCGGEAFVDSVARRAARQEGENVGGGLARLRVIEDGVARQINDEGAFGGDIFYLIFHLAPDIFLLIILLIG